METEVGDGLSKTLSGSWGPHLPGAPLGSQVLLSCPALRGTMVELGQQGREACMGHYAAWGRRLLSHGSTEEEAPSGPATPL